jgi:anti-anti-sigma regulatory factor
VKKKKKAARPAKSGPIELAARMTIAQSVELHRTLAKALASGEPLRLDGSRVEEIDTAILQLLTGAWIDAAQRSVECRWHGTSAVLRNSATLIGVSEILQFDRAA